MEDKFLNTYLDEIGREPLLSDEQEADLARRIGEGDSRALSKLVEANLRFVVKIASQYKGRGVPFDDLISEGNLGLMTAAKKFDASRGVRFVNYAVGAIRQQIERAIEQQSSAYAAPADMASAKSGHRDGGRTLSVDAPLSTRSNMSLLSVLVNHDSPLADERVHSEAVEQAIEFALLSLSERESRIVNAFFGIDREHETMAEIAQDMGLQRERVRQIRNRAIRRIRKVYKHRLRELKN